MSGDGTKFDLNEGLTLETNLIGEHNILNLLFGIAISEEFGIKTEDLADEFKYKTYSNEISK